MTTALIGHTGFVGSNLARQIPFTHTYHSRNIEEIRGEHFDLVVCSGIQAKKWWANQNAEEDRRGILGLLDCLQSVTADFFILVSTVDVYPRPKDVTEQTPIDPAINHAYGKNRFEAEEFVREKFPRHLVLRLPGLFGDGIKKNVIHDLLNDHELEKINPEGVYQYYFLDQLKADILRARELRLSLLNLACEPLGTRELMSRFFPHKTVGDPSPFSASYDMRSDHWQAWNSITPGYLYSKAQTLDQLEIFLKRSRKREG
jgi:hypothetical protein